MDDSQAGPGPEFRGSVLAAAAGALSAASPAQEHMGAAAKRDCSNVRVDLPWDYKLPAPSVRILANILIGAVQSRDRPSEIA